MLNRIFRITVLQVKHCQCQLICKFLFLHLKTNLQIRAISVFIKKKNIKIYYYEFTG
jgi:hypothetical protein